VHYLAGAACGPGKSTDWLGPATMHAFPKLVAIIPLSCCNLCAATHKKKTMYQTYTSTVKV
jgi:hypothetical protein